MRPDFEPKTWHVAVADAQRQLSEQFHAERSGIDRQRAGLEAARREIAAQRQHDPVVAEAVHIPKTPQLTSFRHRHQLARTIASVAAVVNGQVPHGTSWSRSRSAQSPVGQGLGIRLIRQDQIETFNTQIEFLKVELDEAVRQLDQHFADMKSAARERLESLYNPGDYPTSLLGLFQVAWDQLSQVENVLDTLQIDRPRRNILLRPK